VLDAGEPVEGVDFALDTTGSADALRTAVYSTSPGGVTGIIGAPPFGTDVSLGIDEMLTLGRTVRGIVEDESVPAVFIPRLIELWRQGRFAVEAMMKSYDFDQLDEAARDAEDGRVVKSVVKMA
jgi:aryl-alcohol dehydrogenase